jgi:type IV pilus assembly protein PilB
MSVSGIHHLHDERPEKIADGLNVIHLPELPASIGHEQALNHAPVIVYRMHGDPVRAHLEQFVSAQHYLVLTIRDKPYRLLFSELRFLFFTAPVLKPLLEGGIEEAASPQIARAFELIFNDGKKFHATAETIITEPIGIHLFLDKPDNHIYRIFVPKETLKSYNFNTQLHKGLVEHRELEPPLQAVEAAVVRAPESQLESSLESPPAAQPEPPQAQQQPVEPPPQAEPQQEPPTLLDSTERFVTITTIEMLMSELKHKRPLPKQHLGELMVERGAITEQQLYDILIEQSSQPGKYFGEIIEQMKLAPPEIVYSTLAYKLGLPFVKLAALDIDPSVLGALSQELARKHHLFPICHFEERLVMATSDPTNTDVVRMAEFITAHHLEMVVATLHDLEEAIDRHYGQHEDDSVFEHFQDTDIVDDEGEAGEESPLSEVERLSKEKPIVRLVQNMIIDAIRSKASDIHIRPGEKHVDLLYRIDGAMVKMRSFGKTIHPAVVSRIKIIGRMDISERRVPQDGRARVALHNKPVDLRLSVMPTVNGESVVIRILDVGGGLKGLSELGFNERDNEQLHDMINKSYGVLLVTGPTGSGKSTTLYAAINEIRQTDANIITAEDPVEYHIDGIEQMQVNTKVGYTFARILRNILRHDPDVIMVGEIRDQETAKIAIESALTGHLVLSTLHTNSAAVSVTRLLEMGVEPYLINDTLLGVLAQRLVRVNCPHCLAEEKVDDSVIKALGVAADEIFYRGGGCDLCHGTGYKGRMGVYELLTLSPEIHQLISHNAGAEEIHLKALEQGMTPLTQNALEAARARKTSLAEVYRVRLS